MRKILFPILFATIAIFFGFGLLEATTRLLVDNGMQYDLEMWKYARSTKMISENPKIGHIHRPNVTAYAMGVDIHTNSGGFRDREFLIKKKPEVERILMIGDSLTFGWGVTVDNTTAKKLEKILLSNERKVEVINAGIGNTNTTMQVENFLTSHKKYQPDTIILNYFINDAEPVPIYTAPSFLVKHSYAYHFLKGRIDIFLRKFSDTRQDWKQYYHNLYEKEGYWIKTSKAIRNLALYCHKHGIDLKVVNYPVIRELNPYPFHRITDIVRKVADENSIEFLDLYASIKEQKENTLWVTVLDPHPNAKANAIYASAIAHWLQK